MLLLKGATYLETPKHDMIVKVQTAWCRPGGRLLLVYSNQAQQSRAAGGASFSSLKAEAFALALGNHGAALLLYAGGKRA